MTFGTLLREARRAAEMSQRTFAEKCGVSWTYISKLESGDCPPPSAALILALARALGVDEDQFFSAAGKIPPEVAAWFCGTIHRYRLMSAITRLSDVQLHELHDYLLDMCARHR